ncbi:MAG TPA: hypothetical protein PK819_13080, partial [Thermomicrobiales bacterium]|nr:hypothetical protein [Thermomicrobiales bacterium]
MIRFTRRAFFAFTTALFPALGMSSVAAQEVPIEPIETTPTPEPQTDGPSQSVDEAPTPTDAGAETAAGRYFGDTGHNLKDPFLAKWQITGGRDGIGAPISEEHFVEGIGVCQMFAAVTLVFDPGLDTPWDVQATHLA